MTTPTPNASVLCLGTGDGWPVADRNHSSFLYEVGPTRLLVDCGESVCRTLTARRFRWDDLDAILLSHTHADHVGGLFMLLQGMWLDGRTRDLPVHLPGEIIGPLRAMLRCMYLFDQLLGFKLNLIPIVERKGFSVGAVRIRAYRNRHLEGLRTRFGEQHRLSFDSFSFVLTGGGRRIVHSADLGPPADLLPMLRRPVDLLVCELAHFSAPDLVRTLTGRSIAQLAIVHVSRTQRRQLEAIRRRFKSGLPGVRTRFPRDGDRVRVGSPQER